MREKTVPFEQHTLNDHPENSSKKIDNKSKNFGN